MDFIREGVDESDQDWQPKTESSGFGRGSQVGASDEQGVEDGIDGHVGEFLEEKVVGGEFKTRQGSLRREEENQSGPKDGW